jgi:RNA polymerase sigma-70 factor, ECF subfamily
MTVQLIADLDTRRNETLPASGSAVDTEAMLVTAAKGGDSAAFEQLVERYERRVFRLVQSITHNLEDAEDVVQDALVKAYVHLDSFRGDSRFYTWLTRIAINAALMKRRKTSRYKEVALDAPGETEQCSDPIETADGRPTPEQRYSQRQLALTLAVAMRQLSPALRKVCQLRGVAQLSTEETARTLGLSISAVKSRLHRGMERLRLELTPHFERQRQK